MTKESKDIPTNHIYNLSEKIDNTISDYILSLEDEVKSGIISSQEVINIVHNSTLCALVGNINRPYLQLFNLGLMSKKEAEKAFRESLKRCLESCLDLGSQYIKRDYK